SYGLSQAHSRSSLAGACPVHAHGGSDHEPSPPPPPPRTPILHPSRPVLLSPLSPGTQPPAYLPAVLLVAAGGSAAVRQGRRVPALLRRRLPPRLLPGQDGGAVGGWVGFSKAWIRRADRSCESPHGQGEKCFRD
uniref:Uncharacterized protein n=1 Tax=Triticum urartu TaxID=4572 RepID=A0A8R7NWE6_TRIUA